MSAEEDPSDQWFRDTISAGFVQLHAVESTLYSGKTAFQAVQILQTRNWGQCLALDGKIQSSSLDEFIYHEALVHPALLAHPHPRTVLIAGGGEGATLREVLAHRSVKRAVMVDLDREVVELCRRFLPTWHQGAFDDPRTELLHLDARGYLANSEETFDAIIIDVTDPLEEGPSRLLFTREFYQLVRERLAPDGTVSTQAGACSLDEHTLFTAINSTLCSVFPHVLPYQAHIPSFGTVWGFVLAGLHPDMRSLPASEIDRRIATRLTRAPRFYDGIAHQGMFCLPRNLRQAISRGNTILTDAHPPVTAS